MHHAELRPALELLIRARELSEEAGFSDVERADVLYRMGICRYKLTSINTAQTLLSEALDLADRSGIPCDRLRSHILEWRSRCSRRQRDFEAAREDIERALELAERLDDTLTVAHITFQASLDRRARRALASRTHARRTREGAVRGARRPAEPRPDAQQPRRPELPARQVRTTRSRISSARSRSRSRSAAMPTQRRRCRRSRRCISAPATGDLAEEQARHALELLEGRPDFLDETGNAQIVLGRALLEQQRLDEAEMAFAEAELSLSQLSSASHRAVAWTAQGDLASRRGDDSTRRVALPACRRGPARR